MSGPFVGDNEALYFVATKDGSNFNVTALSCKNGNQLWTKYVSYGAPRHMIVDGTGIVLVAGNHTGETVLRLDARTGSSTRLLAGSTYSISPLALLPNGNMICCAGPYMGFSSLHEFNPVTGGLVRTTPVTVGHWYAGEYFAPTSIFVVRPHQDYLVLAGPRTVATLRYTPVASHWEATYDADGVATGQDEVFVLFYPRLRAYDLKLHEIWTAQISPAVNDQNSSYNLSTFQGWPYTDLVIGRDPFCSALISSRYVIIDDGWHLHAYDLKSGKQVWMTRVGRGDYNDSYVAPIICGQYVYAVEVRRHNGETGAFLSAFRLSDGRSVWSMGIPRGYVAESVIADDGFLYLSIEDRQTQTHDLIKLSGGVTQK